MGNRVVFLILAFLVQIPNKAKALNGRDFVYAPEPTLSTMVNGVGALMKKTTYIVKDGDTEHEEILWRVAGNAIYVGDVEKGSVLLVHAFSVMTAEGQPNEELLGQLKVRFAPTVTSDQTDRREEREEFKFPRNTIVKTAPNFVPRGNPKFNTSPRTNTLALVFLPYHFEAPLAPVPIVTAGTKLSLDSAYLVFGHGNKLEATENPGAVLSDYEQDRSSGYLRWTPMKLQGMYAPQALLKVMPMPKEEQAVLFQSKSANQSLLVEGPCANSDAGAPIMVTGTRLVTHGMEKVATARTALVGVMYGTAGACRLPAGKEPGLTSFVDLRDAIYQKWLAEQITHLAPAN